MPDSPSDRTRRSRRRLSLTLGLLWSIPAVAAPGAPDADRPVLSGRVLGGPAAAAVTLRQIAPPPPGEALRVRLDADGFFTSPRLEPGLWRITAEAADGGRLRRVVPVFGATVLPPLELPAHTDATSAPAGWSPAATGPPCDDVELRGRVYAIGSEEIVAARGAWVWIDGCEADVALTGADGRYRIRGPRSDRLTIRAAAAGYVPFDVPIGHRELAAEPRGPSLVLRPAATLAGCVVDRAGRRIDEARVEIERPGGTDRGPRRRIRPAAWTDAAGCFAVQVPAGRPLHLTARAPGFVPQEKDVDPTAEEGPILFRLSPPAAAVGEVFDAHGRPVDGADVTLVPEDSGSDILAVLAGRESASRHHRSTTSGDDGTFQVPDVPEGTYSIVVRARGFEPAVVPGVRVEAGGSAWDVGSVFLSSAAVVAGAVADDAGAPVAGAKVWLALISPDSRGSAANPEPVDETDDQGRFTIDDLTHGRAIEVHVQKDGFLPYRARAVPPTSLSVTLEPASALQGKILNERREPLAGARVTVETSGDRLTSLIPLGERGEGEVAARSGDDGTFLLAPIAAGPIELRADSPCCLPAVQRLEIGRGEVVDDLVIILRSGSSIDGSVSDSAGSAVQGAAVVAAGKSTTSGADGRFRLSGLPDGPLTITARHPDHGAVTERIEGAGDGVHLAFAPSGTLVGRIVDENERGVAGASVLVSGERLDGSQFHVTQRDGSFRLVLGAGRYRVRGVIAGRAEVPEESVDVREGERTEILLSLKPTSTITGRILGVSAIDLGLAGVRAVSSSGLTTAGVVDFEGSYRIEGLRPGSWRIVAELADGRRAETAVEFGEGQDPGLVDLDLTKGNRLEGLVRLDGEPVPRAWVTVTSDTGLQIASTLTDTDGRFAVSGLRDRLVSLRARVPTGDLETTASVDLWNGHPIEIDIRTGRLSGRVSVAGTGNAPAGITIVLSSPGRVSHRFAVRADGAFGPIRLSEGAYHLVIDEGQYERLQTVVEVVPDRETEVHLLLERR